jgi:hypothetical protein
MKVTVVMANSWPAAVFEDKTDADNLAAEKNAAGGKGPEVKWTTSGPFEVREKGKGGRTGHPMAPASKKPEKRRR